MTSPSKTANSAFERHYDLLGHRYIKMKAVSALSLDAATLAALQFEVKHLDPTAQHHLIHPVSQRDMLTLFGELKPWAEFNRVFPGGFDECVSSSHNAAFLAGDVDCYLSSRGDRHGFDENREVLENDICGTYGWRH